MTPQVVEPAHPPINISPKNKTTGKPPQSSNLALTYPVPVKIDIVLKKIDLKLIWVEPFIIRYIDNKTMLIIIIFMKVFICIVGIVVCILIVGYIEDPCATEGLMKGCMD